MKSLKQHPVVVMFLVWLFGEIAMLATIKDHLVVGLVSWCVASCLVMFWCVASYPGRNPHDR